MNEDLGMCLIDVETGEQAWLSAYGFQADPAFSPDGRRFIALMGRQTRVWDTASWTQRALEPQDREDLTRPGRLLPGFPPHLYRCGSLALSPDGRWVGCDRLVLDVRDGAPVASTPERTPIAEMRFSPDGRWLASATVDGALRIWGIRPR